MHASIENLLALRDGEAAASVARHVERCPECRAELERLSRTREALRALPAKIPPARSWAAVEHRLDQAPRVTHAGWWVGGLALAASVLAGVGLWSLTGQHPQQTPALAEDGTVANTPSLRRVGFEDLPLQLRSRVLEERLRSLEPDKRVLTGREALTAAELEDLIALVDYQLARAQSVPDAGADRLWEQRVNLMSGLVQVHEHNARSRGRLQNANYSPGEGLPN